MKGFEHFQNLSNRAVNENIKREGKNIMMKVRQIWVKIKYIKHSKDGGYPTVIRWVLIMCKCQWRKNEGERREWKIEI